jgi:hypothetical protein
MFLKLIFISIVLTALSVFSANLDPDMGSKRFFGDLRYYLDHKDIVKAHQEVQARYPVVYERLCRNRLEENYRSTFFFSYDVIKRQEEHTALNYMKYYLLICAKRNRAEANDLALKYLNIKDGWVVFKE